jgi:uncharacterized protein Smg (DUF494 family)
MQEKVIRIVSLLMKKLLGKGRDPTALLSQLAEHFTQEEIQEAIALIFNLPNSQEGSAYLSQRVLVPQERVKLNGEAQTFLYQIMQRGLLGKYEFELVLWEACLLEIPELGKRELEILLANVITDPERLFLTGVRLASYVQVEERMN